MRSLLLAAALLPLCLGVADAAPHMCAGPVAKAAEKAGVKPGQIERTVFTDILTGGLSGTQTVGFEAWIEQKSCRGAVVVKMSLDCEVSEIYTKGDCTLPGVKGFR